VLLRAAYDPAVARADAPRLAAARVAACVGACVAAADGAATLDAPALYGALARVGLECGGPFRALRRAWAATTAVGAGGGGGADADAPPPAPSRTIAAQAVGAAAASGAGLPSRAAALEAALQLGLASASDTCCFLHACPVGGVMLAVGSR